MGILKADNQNKMNETPHISESVSRLISNHALACLVDGELVESNSKFSVINPATEQTVATISAADPPMIDKAVRAAELAFQSHGRSSAQARQTMLHTIADVIEYHALDLAKLITLEQGKPLTEAKTEVELSCGMLRATSQMHPSHKVLENTNGRKVEMFFAPLGVVAGICPWNFPLATAIMKIGPALMAGNAIIIKPSPTTPLAVLKLGEFLAEITPAGLVQILADNGTVGPQLVTHPGVRKVSFTGSTPAGKQVMAASAATLTRLTLELGGNDPAIILPDVDVESVARTIFSVAFMNCGQICTTIKRVYVHQEIATVFCNALAQCASETKLGDGFDPDVTLGPVQNRKQYEKLLRFMEVANNEGTILTGGRAPNGPGYFLEPTIVTDLKDNSQLVLEEQFGPILPVMRFTDEASVIDKANESAYGLSASVWSADKQKARTIARDLDAGICWINTHLEFDPRFPVSPCKQSGIGVELGEAGVKEFTQAKVVSG